MNSFSTLNADGFVGSHSWMPDLSLSRMWSGIWHDAGVVFLDTVKGDAAMPLTDTTIRNAKAKEKQYKLSDERGLYLLVGKTGRKYFRFDYRFFGKRKTMALGVYPDVSLAEARERRDEARKLIQKGVDPSQHKKEAKKMLKELVVNNFEAIAREWFEKNTNIWTKKHSSTVIRRLEFNVFPLVGSRPIKLITALNFWKSFGK